jgi:Flp pilus assembly protein TadD
MAAKITVLLDQAMSLGKHGRLSEAMALFHQVLADVPHKIDALRGMGLILFPPGNFDDALGLIVQSCAPLPTPAKWSIKGYG